ncbi:MAG: RNA polymerase sigma factor, partial [Gaiellaceae bacterium]
MAAAPSIGRASAVESPPPAPEADFTRDLYERYAGQIYGYCLHKLGSREEAEDAVQNTFLNAFRGLRRGVVPQAESAWLFKIAENVCLSRHRSSFRRGRVETPSDLQAIQDVTPSPERRDDDLIGLEEALARMPESQRRAILLREWQGLSYREISQEMELSQAAVETLIFRARRTLAQGLEDEPKTRRWKKMRQAADTGSIIALLKTLFTTGATVKAVATAVAVTTAVVAASSGELAARHHHASPARPAATSPRVSSSTFSAPLSFAPAASRSAFARAARAKTKPAGTFVLPLSTVGSISSIPGEVTSPAAPADTPAAPAAATPAAPVAATPAPAAPAAPAPEPVAT